MKIKTILFLLFTLIFILIGCNNQTTANLTTETTTTTSNETTTTIYISTTTNTTTITTTDTELLSIEIDESSLEDFYDVYEFDISSIYMFLNYSDNSKERIAINAEMLSTGDNDLLSQTGVHTITVSYLNKSLELTIDLRDTRVFEVVFKDYNNFILDIQYVFYGEDAIAPTEPTREGYIFIGWDTDFLSVEENITIYALYQPIEYTVSFNSMGGSECIPIEGVVYNSSIDLPVTLREDYTFIGWFYGMEPTSKRFYADDLVIGNLILYAHWEEIVFDFTYLEIDEKIIITGLNKHVTNLVIPATVKGMPVIGINEKAFINNANLENIVLPDSLEFIGDYAFYGNENLLSINFGSSLISIGIGAFYGNKRLETVILPDGLYSLGNSAFSRCSNLKEIYIPFSVKEIGSNLLVGCNTIETLTAPLVSPSIHYNFSFIHYYFGALSYEYYGVVPDSLKTIYISEGVETVPTYAFYYCDSVIEIIIPSTVTSIGDYSFMECIHITEYILPEGLTSIGIGAFANNDRLSSINLPSTLNSIGEQAFLECAFLDNITIPEGITEIKYITFPLWVRLSNESFPNGLFNHW